MRIEILKVANPRITCLNLYSTKSKAVARENNFIHLKIRPLVFMLWPNGIRSNVGHRIVQAQSIGTCASSDTVVYPLKMRITKIPIPPKSNRKPILRNPSPATFYPTGKSLDFNCCLSINFQGVLPCAVWNDIIQKKF